MFPGGFAPQGMKIVINRTVLLAGAALVFASHAEASELLASGYDWTGLYAGVNAGILSNSSSLDSSLRNIGDSSQAIKNTIDGDQSSLMGGAMLGYNLQVNHFVLGAEADLDYLGYNDTRKKLQDYNAYDATVKTTFDASWFGTLRGRAGLAAGGFLLYGTAGLAAGNMQATATLQAVDVTTGETAKWKGSTDTTNWGWTAGAGLEYGISNVSFGIEYLYVDLGTADWSGNPSRAAADIADDAQLKGSADYQFSLTRATAKLHF